MQISYLKLNFSEPGLTIWSLSDGCLAAKDVGPHKTWSPAITKYALKVYIFW